MARAGIAVNLVIGVFNLFPLPPLDGGRVLVGLLPWKAAHAVARIEPFGFFIVLALLIAQVIDQWWIRPLVGAGYAILQVILKPLAMLLS
jgi:Zn-dependent protease